MENDQVLACARSFWNDSNLASLTPLIQRSSVRTKVGSSQLSTSSYNFVGCQLHLRYRSICLLVGEAGNAKAH